MTGEKKQEFTLRITNANKSELIVILYEMTYEYLSEMETAVNDKDFRGAAIAASAARNCISELCSSLNEEFEIALNLFGIYEFCQKQISRAQGRMSAEMVRGVKNMIAQLRDAWVKVAEQDTSGPVMENSQEIYTGFTYGRDARNTSSQMSAVSRGYYV